MQRAIGIGNVESAALRSLVGTRCFKKAGCAVNSTTNTYTLTLGGTKQDDDILTVTVTVDGVTETATHTVVTGNADVAAVATAIELVIEALATAVVTSSASGSVVTITPTTTTKAIVISAAVTKATGTPALTATVAQTIIGSKGVKTANTITYSIDGQDYSQTTQTNVAVEGAVLPISSYRWYLMSINAAGTVATTPQADNVNLLPEIPEASAPIGAFKIATNSSVTFTPGVTSLNLTGVTDTYYDLSCVPTAGYPA